MVPRKSMVLMVMVLFMLSAFADQDVKSGPVSYPEDKQIKAESEDKYFNFDSDRPRDWTAKERTMAVPTSRLLEDAKAKLAENEMQECIMENIEIIEKVMKNVEGLKEGDTVSDKEAEKLNAVINKVLECVEKYPEYKEKIFELKNIQEDLKNAQEEEEKCLEKNAKVNGNANDSKSTADSEKPGSEEADGVCEEQKKYTKDTMERYANKLKELMYTFLSLEQRAEMVQIEFFLNSEFHANMETFMEALKEKVTDKTKDVGSSFAANLSKCVTYGIRWTSSAVSGTNESMDYAYFMDELCKKYNTKEFYKDWSGCLEENAYDNETEDYPTRAANLLKTMTTCSDQMVTNSGNYNLSRAQVKQMIREGMTYDKSFTSQLTDKDLRAIQKTSMKAIAFYFFTQFTQHGAWVLVKTANFFYDKLAKSTKEMANKMGEKKQEIIDELNKALKDMPDHVRKQLKGKNVNMEAIYKKVHGYYRQGPRGIIDMNKELKAMKAGQFAF